MLIPISELKPVLRIIKEHEGRSSELRSKLRENTAFIIRLQNMSNATASAFIRKWNKYAERKYPLYYLELTECDDGYHDFERDGERVSGRWRTRSYVEQNCFTCDNCGVVRHISDAYTSDNYDGYRCESCHIDACTDEEGERYLLGSDEDVLDYHAGFLYQKEEVSPLFIGMELETVSRGASVSSCVARIKEELPDYVICKEDGSLSNGGIEIVTVPATLAFHKQKLDKFLSSANTYLKSWHTGCCGIHIHVDRKWFSVLELTKFVLFWNVRNEAHCSFISKLAGRDILTSSWCYPNGGKGWSSALDKTDKYEACNTKPTSTIEVRVFRGNVAKSGVFRNLEFVTAVAYWVKDTAPDRLPESSKDMDWRFDLSYTAFLSWLSDKREKYPYLTEHLVSLGYLRKQKDNEFETLTLTEEAA